MIVDFAYAKINLCLSVEEKKAGKDMHEIDGVYTTCSLCDKVTAEARADGKITLRYTDREIYPNDIALKTATELQKTYQTGGADIVIEKNIPEGAGLGGSSADSAAVVRCFEKLFGFRASAEFLLRRGSDVPFQYEGGLCRVSGKGEKIEKGIMSPFYFVLLIPKKRNSTKECYALFDRVGGEKGSVSEVFSHLQRGELVPLFNSLQQAGKLLCPDTEKGLLLLRESGFLCEMTGSGSAVFGIENSEKKFSEKLKTVRSKIQGDFTLLTATTEDAI